ncbi:MAG: polysaccharide biosynthesis tyrosine autokinase [Chloroflexi bacterium]|nr:MAG: polysaccharide biosynthesis tyrosine autokinase [Chloroflexota bacterium]
MELKQYLSTLWKWSWLIVLSTLIAAVASYWATSRMPRVYKTTTTLMVGQIIQSANPTAQDFWASQQLAQSYVQLVRRQPILQATLDALGMDMDWRALAGKVSAAPVAGTQLIQISVSDTDPQRAKALADEIAHQLILQSPTTPDQEQEQRREFVEKQLADLEAKIEDAKGQIDDLEQRLALETSARGIQDTQNQITALQQKITTWQTNYANLLEFFKGGRINYLSVVEPAPIPRTPVSPKARLNVLLASAIGFLLAAGAAFLLEYMDDTIKSDEDVDRVLKLPTLGAITRIRGLQEPADHLVAMKHPRSPITEAYRVLRTNIQFSSLSNPSTRLLITSAGPGEGKTTTSCNLGITMAQAGMRVILADTDLRRPSIHRFFGVPNQFGLTSLLLDETLPVDSALIETAVPGLRLLPSGPLPPNPAELLGSERMKKRLQELKELADMIIFDSPPVLAVADATILGSLCSGVVLVVDAGRTRTEVIRRGKETLEQVGLKVLGVVLNKLTTRRGGGYYYYYYYSRDGTGGEERGRKSRSRDRGVGLGSRLLNRTRDAAGDVSRPEETRDREP